MDKFDEIKKLKELLDSKVITVDEFNTLKNELLNPNHISIKETNSENENLELKKSNGALKIIYKKMFFLYSPNYKIKIDDVSLPDINLGKNYEAKIPIAKNNYHLKIEYSLLGIFSSKTDIFIDNLDLYKNYIVEVNYDRIAGGFSSEYTINEF